MTVDWRSPMACDNKRGMALSGVEAERGFGGCICDFQCGGWRGHQHWQGHGMRSCESKREVAFQCAFLSASQEINSVPDLRPGTSFSLGRLAVSQPFGRSNFSFSSSRRAPGRAGAVRPSGLTVESLGIYICSARGSAILTAAASYVPALHFLLRPGFHRSGPPGHRLLRWLFTIHIILIFALAIFPPKNSCRSASRSQLL
ncbi:hypothetical protein HPP92_029029 [Vanilla planifolia]|uniref:Uncharacterized protein n=1 Tax=Vanilla planifolia TaxID=51239 RepID=A0A835P3W6_VANPL|nr:hypothetical protein HPP92_029029 [Vanilla planifolia]KAG0446059.1 hypothetical protein HPP92_029017 [Vanilla planifolia]